MKKYFELKTIADSVKDVSEKYRRVKVAISHMGSKDFDNDVIDHTAYNKTIKERGPQGANLIWHLTDHNPSLKSAVGKFSEVSVEGDYLVGVTNIPNTSWGNDVLEFYKTGHINQHSIGFKTIKAEIQEKGKETEYNLIKEVFLYEGSAVLWGANINTPTLGKSMTKEELQSEHEKLSKEMNLLLKSLKDGRFTDDAFEFIEIRTAQINEAIKSIMNTQPAVAVEPDNLIDVIKDFRNKLKN